LKHKNNIANKKSGKIELPRKKINKEGHPDDINVVEAELNLFQH
jgi:hypothetical protein